MVAASTRGQPLPPDTEARLAGFTELVATAYRQRRGPRRAEPGVADEQAALRRVATLVAQGASPAALFQAVAEEIGQLLLADATVLCRYDPDGYLTRVGGWSRPASSSPPEIGRRSAAGTCSTLVFETGQAARLDSYGDDAGDAAVWVAAGLCSSVGVPISVKGGCGGWWSRCPCPRSRCLPDADARLAGFTELVATAIANAEGQAELTASRARIVVTADETRRGIERDLHDGAQQRLVSLALQLRAAQADVPAGLGRLHGELDRVAAGLASTLEELREFARGIHPAILAVDGLGTALEALARRVTGARDTRPADA